MNDQRSNTPETYIAYASQAWRAAESLGPYIGLTSSSRWFEKVMDKSGAEAIYNRYKAWNVGGSQGEQDYKSALAGSAAWLAALIQDPGVGYFHREWTSSAYSLTNTSRPDLNGTGFNNATITKLIAKELWQNTYMDSTFYGGNGSDWGDFTTYHHISRIFGEDPNGGNSPLAGQDPRRAPDPGGARNLSVCGFQWHRNEYGVMMRGRAELDVFLNAIPTIEMSRCTPHLDVKIVNSDMVPIEGIFPSSGILPFPSLERFFVGSGAQDLYFADKLFALSQYPTLWQPDIEQDQRPASSQSGMEVFTAPQTLVNAYDVHYQVENGIDPSIGQGLANNHRPINILDRFRPFLTLESFSVKVVPQLQFMSYKSATLSLTLHDRSRLADLQPLIRPEQRGKTNLVVEWGWNHPSGNNKLNSAAVNDHHEHNGIPVNLSLNPVGIFLNSLKQKEVFGVTNANYSFTPDGQVKINLALWAKGPASMTKTSISEGYTTPSGKTIDSSVNALSDLITEIAMLRKQLGVGRGDANDILGEDLTSSVSSTSTALTMTKKQKGELIRAAKKIYSLKGADPEARKDLAGKLRKLIKATNDASLTISSAVSSRIKACQRLPKGQFDFYDLLLNDLYDKNKTGVIFNHPMEMNNAISHFGKSRRRYKFPRSNWVSFGELVYRFVVMPLSQTNQFDEIQCHFYKINDKASFASNVPLGLFPIAITGAGNDPNLKKVLTEQIKKGGGLTVAEFLGVLNQKYFNNQGLKIYGFSSQFETDKEGKVAVREKKKSVYKNFIDAKLAAAYGAETKDGYQNKELKFVPPRISCLSETVPYERDPTRNILRLHFFDAKATPARSFGDLLDAVRSDIAGAVVAIDDQTRTKDNRPSGVPPVLHEQFVDAVSEGIDAGLLKPIEGTPYYKVSGSPAQFSNLISRNMPTLKVGQETSMLKGINLQTQQDARLSALAMLQSMREQEDNAKSKLPPGAKSSGLPLRILPVECDFELMGFPLLEPFTELFINFSSGTTADDIYICTEVEHNITPGEFSTSVRCVPRASAGVYQSLQTSINRIIADATGLEESTAIGSSISGLTVDDLVDAMKFAYSGTDPSHIQLG